MKIELDKESKDLIKDLTNKIEDFRKTIYPFTNTFERYVQYLERNKKKEK